MLVSVAPVKTKVGRTTMTGVLLGQDSSTFQRHHGVGQECFYVGEAVSVIRSDGRRHIAEVMSISPAGMGVNLGADGMRVYTPTDVPNKASKLLGAFYFAA